MCYVFAGSSNLVRFAVNNCRRKRLLRPPRIDRDDAALTVDALQELRNCRDFIRLLRTSDLPQRQAEFAGPDADGMQSAQTFAAS